MQYAMVQEALLSLPQSATAREHVNLGWRALYLEGRSDNFIVDWRLVMEYPKHGDRVRILPNGAAVYCFPWRMNRAS